MQINEYKFENHLRSLGVVVKKLESGSRNKGNPDFLCNYGENSFYIEHKTNFGTLMSCNASQWEKISELIRAGEKVFLAIQTRRNTFFFELNDTLNDYIPHVGTGIIPALTKSFERTKVINVDFDDDDFEELAKLKHGRSWHDWILEIARKEADEN